VINQFANTVSVINLTSSAVMANVPVGEGPTSLAINPQTNMIYVANYDSSTISVTDGNTNKVIAGVTFNVNPSDSGYIQCNHANSPSPLNQYIYLYSGSQCSAKPSEGFEFVSWEENLEGNSTQLITVSKPASNWDSISAFFGFKPDEPEATIPITKFGTFTANFKELPPAVPSEYMIPLYGIIITSIVGWSIPTIIGWTKSKREARKLNYFHKQITFLYRDSKLDENDIGPVNRLRSDIVDEYSKGKLNEKHYENLRNEISILYKEILRKRIDALNNSNDLANKKTTDEKLAQIRDEIEYAYSEGKINDTHYTLLNKAIFKSR
jgi:YVTN family beta-propeller protein